MQSTLDALGKNPSTGRTAPSTLKHVILVQAATKVRPPFRSLVRGRCRQRAACCCMHRLQGVSAEGYAKAIATVKAAGAVVVDAVAPKDAIAQFCDATGAQ